MERNLKNVAYYLTHNNSESEGFNEKNNTAVWLISRHTIYRIRNEPCMKLDLLGVLRNERLGLHHHNKINAEFGESRFFNKRP